MNGSAPLPGLARPERSPPAANATGSPPELITVSPKWVHAYPGLTKELLNAVEKDNVVIVTFGNYAYMESVTYFVKCMQRANVTNYIIGALDKEGLTAFAALGARTFDMGVDLSNHLGFKSADFLKLGLHKTSLAYVILKMGFSVVITDLDTAWLRDPNEYFARYLDVDILSSTDYVSSSLMARGAVGLEDPLVASRYDLNIGLMLLRPPSLPAVEEWGERLARDEKLWDQNAFNHVVKEGWNVSNSSRPGRAVGFQGKLQVGILPLHLFPHGYAYGTMRISEKYNSTPYVVHGAFTIGGVPGKRHLLREGKIWLDPPDYYSADRLYIRLDLKVNPELLASFKRGEGVEGMRKNVALMIEQFKQIRQVIAMAVATKRTLIMPDLTCGYDQWGPHDGVVPYSELELPFKCPMMYVFDVEAWNKWDHPEFPLSYREYSFLDNPQTAKMAEYFVKTEDVPQGGFDEISAAAFSTAHTESVLNLHTIPYNTTLWKGFTDPAKQARFVESTKPLTCSVCCPPGGKSYRYDMWVETVELE